MINIKVLQELAKIEYKKVEGNYSDKIAELNPLYKDLVRRVDEVGGFPTDEQIKENIELHNKSMEYHQKEQVDLCYTATKILCSPEYTETLVANSEKLGNEHLSEKTLVKFLQEFGVFTAIWKATSIDYRNLWDVFTTFVKSYDVVLDVVSKKNSVFNEILKLNEYCKKSEKTFSKLIADKVDKFGKEKTVDALIGVLEHPEYFHDLSNQNAKFVSRLIDLEATSIPNNYQFKHAKTKKMGTRHKQDN